jgi:threonine synthase
MVLAVAKALEDGSDTIICASTGNTSASAAAYAARTGMACVVIVSAANVALGKLTQTRAYSAKVVDIGADFDTGLRLARELSERAGVTLVNSVNQNRLEGQKTAAFEVIDSLGSAPDEVFVPVGNAGNISAYWAGFCQYKEGGRAGHAPRMRGFQAAGAAPIVLGRPVANPQTIASALRIGNPASWAKAVRAGEESGGSIETVTDSQILDSYRLLGSLGIFCEPASAASVAGLIDRADRTLVDDRSRVVCVITGHGLKDPELADRESRQVLQGSAEASAVSELLGW